MSQTGQKVIVSILAAILVGVGGYYLYKTKFDLAAQFDVSAEKIAKDLEGRTAPLPYGQVWPFESNQNITVKIVGKKQVDEYVQIIVELGASAMVEPPKSDKKEEKPAPVKSFKVTLSGLAKITYEKINAEWYIVGVDTLSLRALPIIEPLDKH